MEKKIRIFGRELPLTWSDLFFTLALIAFGVVLIAWPGVVREYLLVAIGVIVMLNGLGRVIRYFRASGLKRMKSYDLMYGLFWLTLGLTIIVGRGELGALLIYLFGILMVVAAAFYLQNMINMKYMKSEKWYLFIIGAVISLTSAVLIFAIADLPLPVVGAALTAQGVMFILARIFFNRFYVQMEKMDSPLLKQD